MLRVFVKFVVGAIVVTAAIAAGLGICWLLGKAVCAIVPKLSIAIAFEFGPELREPVYIAFGLLVCCAVLLVVAMYLAGEEIVDALR